MRKIIICFLVALFLPFLMTCNIKAEELEDNTIDVLDFSEASKIGGEVSIKSMPIFPPNDSEDIMTNAFVTFLDTFNHISAAPGGNPTGGTNWFAYLKIILVYAVPVLTGGVFFWWGLRKTISAIMSAFKKGKLRL